MRNGSMNRFIGAAIALLLIMSAQAGEWSYFSYLGNSISVSFNQVDATTYTWKFRNDASSRITYMEFTYSYIDASSGLYKTDKDVLPGSLGPGETFGGWAAFTANARAQPIIQITRIDRQ